MVENSLDCRSAEVKVLTKPELARGYMHHERTEDRKTKSTLQDADLKILDKLSNSQYRTKCGLRFLSLHRVRRRPRPALKCSKEHSSLLDTQYTGPAMRQSSRHSDVRDHVTNSLKLVRRLRRSGI
ncbi:hypothetical protein LSH36_340g06053 [Paralvinella palmiformis]|uniref:Uncharacterized protein n=1 Tax=Paralvinella palmiformis TaxID=53620 RepID=A0AAD9JFA5_9ANNE|nr:hypothetical protein LSH36_340g06053 [Paralvinella palmiformis]